MTKILSTFKIYSSKALESFVTFETELSLQVLRSVDFYSRTGTK